MSRAEPAQCLRGEWRGRERGVEGEKVVVFPRSLDSLQEAEVEGADVQRAVVPLVVFDLFWRLDPEGLKIVFSFVKLKAAIAAFSIISDHSPFQSHLP